MFVKHKLKGTEELPFYGHSVVFDKHQSYRVLCLKMFHKVSLVWQLYRTNLCGKVTIAGTLCGTNKMTNCWKFHSPVFTQAIDPKAASIASTIWDHLQVNPRLRSPLCLIIVVKQ